MYLNRQGVRENLRVMFKRPTFLRLLSTLTIGVPFWSTRTANRPKSLTEKKHHRL